MQAASGVQGQGAHRNVRCRAEAPPRLRRRSWPPAQLGGNRSACQLRLLARRHNNAVAGAQALASVSAHTAVFAAVLARARNPGCNAGARAITGAELGAVGAAAAVAGWLVTCALAAANAAHQRSRRRAPPRIQPRVGAARGPRRGAARCELNHRVECCNGASGGASHARPGGSAERNIYVVCDGGQLRTYAAALESILTRYVLDTGAERCISTRFESLMKQPLRKRPAERRAQAHPCACGDRARRAAACRAFLLKVLGISTDGTTRKA